MATVEERLLQAESTIELLVQNWIDLAANKKNAEQLNTATSITSDDEVVVFQDGEFKQYPANAIGLGAAFWIVIENCLVKKGAGKTSTTAIEATDIVYFKQITNGTDPMTLVGWTYDGGDKQLLASYTQNQTIAT